MRVKIIACLLLGFALCHTEMLSAGPDSTAVKQAPDISTLGWRKDKKISKKLLKQGKTADAIPYLEAGVAKKPKKKYFPQNLAPSELAVRDYKSSNQWYKVLVDRDSVKHKKSPNLFQYALTQKYLGQYEAAIATFAKYRSIAGDDETSVDLKKKAIRESLGCQKGIYFRDSVPEPAFKVKPLGPNLGIPVADQGIRQQGNNLYFSSDKGSNAGYTRIFSAPKQGKEWGLGTALSDNINTANKYIGHPTFTQDGNTMYYTQCETGKKCQIYKSTLANGEWSKGVSVGAQVNDPLYTNMQPALGLNKDGEDILFFVSDRNPGKGLDIFYSKINRDGSLGKPQTIGSQVNTRGDEMSPYYDFKSKTLYFSSNGWINIGGMDVFKSTVDANGDWTDPENLGMPVNSSADDIDFSINDRITHGFVVSNRPVAGDGKHCETCTDNVYQVETTKLFLAARGSVYEATDSTKNVASDGNVILIDDKKGTELGSYTLVNGGYFFDLKPKNEYKLITKKDGFNDGLATFNTYDNTDNDTLNFDLALKKKPSLVDPLIGRVIGKIYYEYDQARLKPGARDTLRAVMDIMNQYPNYMFEIGAHTDSKGTEEYNLYLSQKRADAVMNYYIYDKKVSKERLVAKAYGVAGPAAPNTTPDGKDNPAGRALNRRTEFKIIGTYQPEAKPAKVEKDLAPAKPVKESKPANVEKKPEVKAEKKAIANPTKKEDETVAKVVKKAIAPVKAPEVLPAKKETKNTAPDGEYKTAPKQPLVLSGKVYIEKTNKRTLVSDAAVFLTTNEGGFQQKVFYVKADGSYSFDLSRAAADTFTLIARKYTFESNEVVLTLDSLRSSNSPIDLVIKMK